MLSEGIQGYVSSQEDIFLRGPKNLPNRHAWIRSRSMMLAMLVIPVSINARSYPMHDQKDLEKNMCDRHVPFLKRVCVIVAICCYMQIFNIYIYIMYSICFLC